ncbi:protein translocase subunit SecD [Bounagaea algeriensis]
MAPPAGHIRPGRYLAVFALIIAVLYSLVFFTGDRDPSPKLGIDLQGGTRVTLTAQTPTGEPPSNESLDQARQIIETRVNGMGVSGSEVSRDGNNLVITVPGAGGEQARQLGQTAKLQIRQVAQQVPNNAPPQQQQPQQQQQQQNVGDQPERIAAAKETRQSSDPNVLRQAAQNLDCNAPDPLRGHADPTKPLVTCKRDGSNKYILEPVLLEGQQIEDAQASAPGQQDPQWTVNLRFKPEGAQKWGQFTSANQGQQAAFVLDSEVVSAPRIQSPSSSSTQITGQFNQESATQLAETLKYGSLPLAFQQSEAQTVSPTIGVAALKAGLIAGAIGLAFVAVYCLVYYRLLGVLTVLSLVLSGAVVYGALVLLGRWIGFTLDLAGVAGFIIAIGITADSFIVYFERIKDEIREGRTFRSAVPRAWERARRTILASDAISVLASVVLYILAVGEVKGFAFTLGMSTVLDLIVVFLVTHPLVAWASRKKALSKPGVTGLGAVQRIAAASRGQRRRTANTKEA